MVFEFQERMIILEEWLSCAQKGDSVWVTHVLSTEVCISTQEWQGVKTVEIKSMVDLVLVKKDML